MLRKIDDEDALLYYHKMMPWEYIVQSLVEYPMEVSVFHIRYPNESKGVVTGFIQKDLMEVVGDGKSTVWELILQHPQARYRLDEMKIDLQHKGVKRTDKDFAVAWAKNYGKGRVFYSTFGHREDAWDRPDIQKMYLEAIKWAMGITQGDATPRPKPAK